jgi:hypothetical protein
MRKAVGCPRFSLVSERVGYRHFTLRVFENFGSKMASSLKPKPGCNGPPASASVFNFEQIFSDACGACLQQSSSQLA